MIRHPFSNVEPAIIEAALLKMAESKIEKFPVLLDRTLEILKTSNPLLTLSIIANYGLQSVATSAGVAARTMMPDIEQFHLELLQAIAMTLPIDQWGVKPTIPTDIQDAIEVLTELGSAFHQRRFKAIEGEKDEQARVVLALQERLRLHTQMVRNWGYFSDVVDISTALYSPMDEALRSVFGFSSTELITVAKCMTRIIERRSTDRINLLSPVFRERNIRRLVKAYYRVMPDIKGDPDEFIAAIPTGVSSEEVKTKLLAHADLRLIDIFTFRPDDIAILSSTQPDIVKAILNSLSIVPGSLAGEDRERIFLSNPVWRRPVISLGDSFICVMPQSILSHIHEIMRSLVEQCETKPPLEKIRSTYLETKVRDLLKKAFPMASSHHGMKWRVDATEYETDHVLLIDNTVIIVEDKSHALTAPGLRGAPDRVKRHVQELIATPSEQSLRLEKHIWLAKGGDVEAVERLKGFNFNYERIDQIVRVSVTLDDFSVLASSEPLLKKAGWIEDELPLAITINVADFQCVIEILEQPSFIVHYFAERGRIQKSLDISADEIDFLGFYLETGFNIWGIEKEKMSLELTGMSRAIDTYKNSLDIGIETKKPAPKLTPYFAQLVEAIEARAFLGWLGVTTDLLKSMSYSEQKKLDHLLEKLRAVVKRDWRKPGHECCLILSPPEIRETAIVFYAFPAQLAHERKKTAMEMAVKALEISGRSRCVVLSKCIDRWSDPYAFIFIANSKIPAADVDSTESN
jgi:hypothetical protein